MIARSGRTASSVVRMSRRLVSAASCTGASASPRRWARIPDLGRRLLARDIEAGQAAPGETGGGLQQKRRLADAGIAANEDRRGRDKAAAKNPGQAHRRPTMNVAVGFPRSRGLSVRSAVLWPPRASLTPDRRTEGYPRRSSSTRRSHRSARSISCGSRRIPYRKKRGRFSPCALPARSFVVRQVGMRVPVRLYAVGTLLSFIRSATRPESSRRRRASACPVPTGWRF